MRREVVFVVVVLTSNKSHLTAVCILPFYLRFPSYFLLLSAFICIPGPASSLTSSVLTRWATKKLLVRKLRHPWAACCVFGTKSYIWLEAIPRRDMAYIVDGLLLHYMLCQVKKLVQISCSHASSHDLSPSHLMFVFQGSIFQCRWLIAIDACREQTRSVINLTVITSTPAASAATSLTIESTNLITKKAKKDNFAVEEE